MALEIHRTFPVFKFFVCKISYYKTEIDFMIYEQSNWRRINKYVATLYVFVIALLVHIAQLLA